jgi:ribonuclease P protein component
MKRENRVLKHQEFDCIIQSTPFVRSQHYVIHYRQNVANKARIGISVSKKNGDAVTRNRIKRQVRAMIAGGYDLKQSFDIIIIVRSSYHPEQFHEEEKELLSSLSKIGEKH